MLNKIRESSGPATAQIVPPQNDDIDDYLYDEDEDSAKKVGSWIGRHRWTLALAIIVIAATAYYLGAGDNSAVSSKPLTVGVEFGDIENAVSAAGSLQPSQYVDVGAQVSGQLEKLYVEVGDQVTTGQLVAEIDATVQMNKVEASRANLEALEAQLSARESALALAQARLERQHRMMSEDATSQDDYDDAVDRLVSAQSSLTQLKSQIKQASASLGSDEATLGYSRIYAPMSGTVVSIAMKEGQTLNAAQMAPTILTIADLTTMTVEAEVSEADVSKLVRGMEVYFTTLGNGKRRWSGTLGQILPTPVIENNVVLYTALFDVDNSDGTLLTNMTAQVFFLTDYATSVLKVPVAALSYPNQQRSERGDARPTSAQEQSWKAGGLESGRIADTTDNTVTERSGRLAYVRIVNADGSLEQRAIRVGVTSRIAAEVVSGLQAGEQVVAGVVDVRNSDNNRRRRPFGLF